MITGQGIVREKKKLLCCRSHMRGRRRKGMTHREIYLKELKLKLCARTYKLKDNFM
jgi:hypothetical protein